MANQQQAPANLPNYLLQIDLLNVTNPSISRTLSVPASTTFHTLHCAIQVAFDWRDSHVHSFEIFNATPAANASREHGILAPRPPVLLKLDPNPERDTSPFGPAPQSSKQWRLRDVFENPTYKDKAIEYLYDFGDNWMHSITLIGRALMSTSKIVCLSGEGSPAGEDCGGAHGWQDLKEVYQEHADEDPPCDNKEAHRCMEWYEDDCLNGRKVGLEPWRWDRAAVNAEFAKSNGLMARIARG
jgi:Plasmid pRiA4b ORF-3-like protein